MRQGGRGRLIEWRGRGETGRAGEVECWSGEAGMRQGGRSRKIRYPGLRLQLHKD